MNTPSKYQSAVFDQWRQGDANTAVVSVAGSGKTWTAIEGIANIPKHCQVLLSAFNKDIKLDFMEKGLARGYSNVTYSTFNAFGWGVCLNNLKSKPELDKDKTGKILEFKILRLDWDDRNEVRRFYTMRPVIEKLVSLFKAFCITEVDEVSEQYEQVVDRYDIDEPEVPGFKNIFLETYAACLTHQAHYDFDDQKFMPIYLDLPIPQYDVVIADEFQDACPLEVELLRRAMHGGMFYVFGDPDQTIYSFKGSHPDTFPKFIDRFDAVQLPLSICYRCSEAVVTEAQYIVPRIESAPGAIRGSVGTEKQEHFLSRVQDRDFVLCRCTEDLVRTQIELTELGRKSKVRGREFGTALEQIIYRISRSDTLMDIGSFTTALLDYQMERSEQLTKIRREAEVQRLEDRCNSIRALCMDANCSNVQALRERLANVFTDSPHDGIDCMTIHKSKGLQSKNVWIARPDLLPHPRSAKRQWMLEEEMRLKYVGITRAQESLYWIAPPPREK